MSNLSQIKAQFLSRIAQNATSGQVDFTDAEQTTLANEAIQFTAVRTEYPRDHINVVLEALKPVYALPTDNLNIILAYLADSNNQKQKLMRLYSEKEIVESRPSWMDESQTGEPSVVLLLDRSNIFVSPSPDAVSAGKKLILTYNYYPAALISDTEEPDLPLAFHPLIPIYMAHSAYSGKLLNPDQANALFAEYEKKFEILNTPAVREKDQLNWFWNNSNSGMSVDLDDEGGGVRFI